MNKNPSAALQSQNQEDQDVEESMNNTYDEELDGEDMISHGDTSDQRQHFMNNLISNFEMNRPTKKESLRKKHVRRCAKELKKEFPCLYNCGKEYATDAARNMHMREKHNEVTKTERDRKAREIMRNIGLKSNSDIVNKLSSLTQVQQ